jgi:CheY-like chemotaxis protein/Tfp pilus assembly protein PilZ
MKKVLIAQGIHKLLQQKNSFLDRADMEVFTAASNDETLEIHREKRVHLIITELDMPGMRSEQLFSLIRKDPELRAVSVLMICPDNPAAIEQSARCSANAALPRPVKPAMLLAKAQQLLDIAWRETYRVLVSVEGNAVVQGNPMNTTFFCRSQNISTSGLLIETDKMLAQGDRVLCSFFLPDSIRIQATGEIVRILPQAPGANAKQYGVKFSSLTHEARQALQAFVDKKSQKTRPGAP